jgi:hypothetical protein
MFWSFGTKRKESALASLGNNVRWAEIEKVSPREIPFSLKNKNVEIMNMIYFQELQH